MDLDISTKAFLGGISQGRGLVHYVLHDKSIDKPKFMAFLKELKNKMVGCPWILYLDNLKVHTCRDTVTFMEEEGIKYILSPVYSPELNAIEFYFSQLKDNVKKARLKAMISGYKPTYELLVENAVKKIKKEVVDECILHVFKLFKLK